MRYSANINLNLQNDDGLTVLHRAVMSYWQCSESLKILLGALGICIDCRDKHGRTPLTWAAICRSGGKIEALLEKRADLHQRDVQGRTAY